MQKRNSRSMRFYLPMLFMLSALALPVASQAALNAYLQLACNGTDIPGETSVFEIGGVVVEDHIEVVSFGFNVSVPFDAATGAIRGTRQYRPVRVLKAVDKSSPRLQQALAEGQDCEATFRFFRLNTDDGTTQHYYTVKLTGARIVAMIPTLGSTLDPASATLPMLETISILFLVIEVTDEVGSTTYQDDWRGPR